MGMKRVTVTLHEAFVDRMDRAWRNSPLAFPNRSEFIRYALKKEVENQEELARKKEKLERGG